MNEIIFNYNSNSVRTVIINSEPFFCVSDIGKILDLTNAYRQVKEFTEGVHSVTTPTPGGNQEIIYISEPCLYELIFKSRKKNAKQFRKWVFSSVLPSLRKTGKYSIAEELTQKSKVNRKLITSAWQECGIKKPHHFIQLTLQEYKALGLSKDKRKKNMSKEEILLLSALESMETLKLFYDKKDGYYECKDSLNNTAQKVIESTAKKEIK